jgi:hypothetical protein
MENHNARTAPAKGPVKVKSGDFDPEGSSKTPLIDDNPPRTQRAPSAGSPQDTRTSGKTDRDRKS